VTKITTLGWPTPEILESFHQCHCGRILILMTFSTVATLQEILQNLTSYLFSYLYDEYTRFWQIGA